MAVAGPVAKPHLCIISTGNKHLAGWHWNLAFKGDRFTCVHTFKNCDKSRYTLVVMIFSFIIMNLSTESTNVVESQPKLMKECLIEFQ